MSGHSKWCETSRNVVGKNIRMKVCARRRTHVCVFVKASKNLNFCISGITWPIELKLVAQIKLKSTFFDIYAVEIN